MGYYPAFLDIIERPCVVVGGGVVAERKVLGLLEAGATVTVISPKVTEKINKLVNNKTVRHIGRGYRDGDLEGASLAISASSSKAVNKRVSEEAGRMNVPVLVVDAPALSTFIVPSVIRRGDLTIAVSTSGKCPAMSKKLRGKLERDYGQEYGVLVDIAGAVRNKLLKYNKKNDKNRIIGALLDSPMLQWIREGAAGEIDAFLKGLLDMDCTLKGLGIDMAGRGPDKKVRGRG